MSVLSYSTRSFALSQRLSLLAECHRVGVAEGKHACLHVQLSALLPNCTAWCCWPLTALQLLLLPTLVNEALVTPYVWCLLSRSAKVTTTYKLWVPCHSKLQAIGHHVVVLLSYLQAVGYPMVRLPINGKLLSTICGAAQYFRSHGLCRVVMPLGRLQALGCAVWLCSSVTCKL